MCVNCKLCLHLLSSLSNFNSIERKIFPPYELSIHYIFYDQISGEWSIAIVLNDTAGRKKNNTFFWKSFFFVNIKSFFCRQLRISPFTAN